MMFCFMSNNYYIGTNEDKNMVHRQSIEFIDLKEEKKFVMRYIYALCDVLYVDSK